MRFEGTEEVGAWLAEVGALEGARFEGLELARFGYGALVRVEARPGGWVSVFDLDGLLSAEVRGLQAPSSDGGHKDVVRWARVRRSGERTRLEVDCGKMSFRAVSARVSVVLPYEWRSMLAAAREPTL